MQILVLRIPDFAPLARRGDVQRRRVARGRIRQPVRERRPGCPGGKGVQHRGVGDEPLAVPEDVRRGSRVSSRLSVSARKEIVLRIANHSAVERHGFLKITFRLLFCVTINFDLRNGCWNITYCSINAQKNAANGLTSLRVTLIVCKELLWWWPRKALRLWPSL